ncbi:MAG: DUF423 domain-containing protein [Gemmatimonadales bacterium]
MTARGSFALGGVMGALGVALGAFGAHGLRSTLSPADLATFETAVRYQLAHALALIGIAAWADRHPSTKLAWAGRLFGLGVLIFSGSLYLLVLLDQRWLGAVTPFGGAAMIAGWLLVVAAALDTPR